MNFDVCGMIDLQGDSGLSRVLEYYVLFNVLNKSSNGPLNCFSFCEND